MRKIGIIDVPSSAGARRTGQERAPQAFRQAGFIEHLQSAGLEVIDFGDPPEVLFQPDQQHPEAQNLQLVVDVAQRVANQVVRSGTRQCLTYCSRWGLHDCTSTTIHKKLYN